MCDVDSSCSGVLMCDYSYNARYVPDEMGLSSGTAGVSWAPTKACSTETSSRGGAWSTYTLISQCCKSPNTIWREIITVPPLWCSVSSESSVVRPCIQVGGRNDICGVAVETIVFFSVVLVTVPTWNWDRVQSLQSYYWSLFGHSYLGPEILFCFPTSSTVAHS